MRCNVFSYCSIFMRTQNQICVVSRRFKALRRHTLKALSVDEADKLLPKRDQPNRITSPVLSIRKPPGGNKSQEPADLERYANSLKRNNTNTSRKRDASVKALNSNNVAGIVFAESDLSSKSKDKKINNITDNAAAFTEIKYETLSEGDKRFGPYILTAKALHQRGKVRTVLLEGLRLISDAVSAGVAVKAIYFTDPSLLSSLPMNNVISSGIKLYRVRNKHMKVWSDMTTPPGIMAVCVKPKTVDIHLPADELLPLTLICDSIKDPSEMGVILRSAAAACCEKIIVCRGCVDVWDNRVLRAGAGAQFHTHIIEGVQWDLMTTYLENSDQIYINDNTAYQTISQTTVTRENLPDRNGSSVPQDKLQNTNGSSVTQENLRDNNRNSATIRPSLVWKSRGNASNPAIPTCFYDELNVSGDGSSVTLIVSTATDGLSKEAQRFIGASGRGQYVRIPYLKPIAPLSLAATTSILLFEIKRQLTNL